MDGENRVAESVGKGDTRTQTVSGKRLKIHPKGSQLCLHCEASKYTLIYACVFGSVCVVVCTYSMWQTRLSVIRYRFAGKSQSVRAPATLTNSNIFKHFENRISLVSKVESLRQFTHMKTAKT